MYMVIGRTSFTGIIQEMDIFQPLITTRFVLIQPTLLVSKSMIVGRILGPEKWPIQMVNFAIFRLRVEDSW